MKIQLNEARLAGLPTTKDILEKKYGAPGSESRLEFEAKARAWYCAEILKDARKASGMTQCQVAERIGKKREYVALIEKGETDMQLSTFFMLSEAVGLQIQLKY